MMDLKERYETGASRGMKENCPLLQQESELAMLPSPQEFLKAKDARQSESDEVKQLMSVVSRAMKAGRSSVTFPTPQKAEVVEEVCRQMCAAGYQCKHQSEGLVYFTTLEWGIQDHPTHDLIQS